VTETNGCTVPYAEGWMNVTNFTMNQVFIPALGVTMQSFELNHAPCTAVFTCSMHTLNTDQQPAYQVKPLNDGVYLQLNEGLVPPSYLSLCPVLHTHP
jgi:hypothetical protein